MVMTSERTLGAGAGELSRGRQIVWATIGGGARIENPNEPELQRRAERPGRGG